MQVASPSLDPERAQRLLELPVADDDRPDRRWAYPSWARWLVSLFVAYHVVVVAVYNLPNEGLTYGINRFMRTQLQSLRYTEATGNKQLWDMFAPDPWRANVFLGVKVVDRRGKVHDMRHDVHSRRRYPYLRYDRVAKINRRLLSVQGVRPVLAAWYCRQWELDHDGIPAREVRLYRRWTSIPFPSETPAEMVFDPQSSPVGERLLKSYTCAKVAHGQVPPRMRDRFGLPPLRPGRFRPVFIRNWTHGSKRPANTERNRRKRNTR